MLLPFCGAFLEVFTKGLPLNFATPLLVRANPTLPTGFPYLYAAAPTIAPPIPIITASEPSPNLWAIPATVLSIAFFLASSESALRSVNLLNFLKAFSFSLIFSLEYVIIHLLK